MVRKKPDRDLYAEVTESVVKALEHAGKWSRPWAQLGLGASNPRNTEGRPYRGVNTVLLWASALEHGYASGEWGTFKAWFRDREATPDEVEAAERGEAEWTRQVDGEWRTTTRCVRRGEHATLVALFKPTRRRARPEQVASGEADDDGRVPSLYLTYYNVFAGEQVHGWEPTALDLDPVERDAAADAFFEAVGADVRHGGDRAFYAPGPDFIGLPDPDQFVDAGAYYATSAHEHGHWTGHKTRLARDFTGRFGDDAYAMEELVAELTAAFVCARLGLEPTVRDDHASYVAHWVRVLKSDERAVVTAASNAQRATDFLVGLTEPAEQAEPEAEEVAA